MVWHVEHCINTNTAFTWRSHTRGNWKQVEDSLSSLEWRKTKDLNKTHEVDLWGLSKPHNSTFPPFYCKRDCWTPYISLTQSVNDFSTEQGIPLSILPSLSLNCTPASREMLVAIKVDLTSMCFFIYIWDVHSTRKLNIFKSQVFVWVMMGDHLIYKL